MKTATWSYVCRLCTAYMHKKEPQKYPDHTTFPGSVPPDNPYTICITSPTCPGPFQSSWWPCIHRCMILNTWRLPWPWPFSADNKKGVIHFLLLVHFTGPENHTFLCYLDRSELVRGEEIFSNIVKQGASSIRIRISQLIQSIMYYEW